jgi:hypothetical protein
VRPLVRVCRTCSLSQLTPFGILPTAPSSFAMIYGKLNDFFAEVL